MKVLAIDTYDHDVTAILIANVEHGKVTIIDSKRFFHKDKFEQNKCIQNLLKEYEDHKILVDR